MWKRSSRNGSDIPTRLPITTTSTIVVATITATSCPPRKAPIKETASAMVRPRAAETATSLPSSANQSPSFTSPVASARIIRVEAWEPALPALAISKGRKKTSATTVPISSS